MHALSPRAAAMRRSRLRRRRARTGMLAGTAAVAAATLGLEFAGIGAVNALGTTGAAVSAIAQPTQGLPDLLTERDSQAASRAAGRSALPADVARANGERELSADERQDQIDRARQVAADERAARAERRAEKLAATKAAAKRAAAVKKAAAKRLAAAKANPQAAAQRLLGEFGFGADQMSCLTQLWIGESNWNYRAANPSSSAYGIPQALPGSKMATAGADWRTNPETQIRWGLGYIAATYGTPCGALGAWNSRSPHWY